MSDYEILSKVGEGAYGVVLKARYTRTDKIVAIKKYKGIEDDEDVQRSALRESQSLAKLIHPNIVKLHKIVKSKNSTAIIIEFVSRNLLEILSEKNNGLDMQLIRKIIKQLLYAISYCHQLQIIHRDIKPENILISEDYDIKLCDFGFARFCSEDSRMTNYVSTRWYRSPEILMRNHYGPSSDIWAIGCLMGELIDGNPLFPGRDEIDQLTKIRHLISNDSGNNGPEKSRLYSRYKDLSSRCAIDLLEKMLTYDSGTRITATDALRHPFFDIEEPSLVLREVPTRDLKFEMEANNKNPIDKSDENGVTALSNAKEEYVKLKNDNDNKDEAKEFDKNSHYWSIKKKYLSKRNPPIIRETEDNTIDTKFPVSKKKETNKKGYAKVATNQQNYMQENSKRSNVKITYTSKYNSKWEDNAVSRKKMLGKANTVDLKCENSKIGDSSVRNANKRNNGFGMKYLNTSSISHKTGILPPIDKKPG